jgi:hypothetical protein
MGVYMVSTGTPTALRVIEATSFATAVAPNDMLVAERCLVVTPSGTALGVGIKLSSDPDIANDNSSLALFAAATQSTIDASSSTAETVARDGNGASVSYVVSGASAWNVSAEGLLDLVSGSGTGKTVLDAALDKLYVVVKFEAGPGLFYMGQGVIESAQISGGVDDMATYSATIKGYGKLYPSI